MAKELKPGDVLARADFRLVGIGWSGQEVDERVHAELYITGGFQYGNRTGMSFRFANGNVEAYDTRYEKVSKRNFKQFAYKVLRDRTMENIQIETL